MDLIQIGLYFRFHKDVGILYYFIILLYYNCFSAQSPSNSFHNLIHCSMLDQLYTYAKKIKHHPPAQLFLHGTADS